MLRDREYVYAVYQEGSFSRAAQKLFISQPALSAKVKRAEERVGTPLFDRSSSPVQLTPAGRYYIQAVERVMLAEEELREQLGRLAQRRAERVSVGSSAYFCSYVLPQLAAAFRRRFPNCTVELLEGNTGELTQCLQSGVVDFVLDVDDLDPGQFTAHAWGREELILAVPAALEVNRRLGGSWMSFEQARQGLGGERVGLEEFQEEEFLLLKQGNDIYRRALAMCREAGFKPKVRMYLDQMLTSYHVAASGQGIAFVRPGVLLHVKPTQQLCFYRLNSPKVEREIYFYQKKETALAPIAREFLGFAREQGSLLL